MDTHSPSLDVPQWRAVCRDPDLNRRFLAQGYLHESLFGPKELDALRDVVARHWKHGLGPPNGAGGPARPFESSYIDDDTQMREAIDAEVRAILAPQVDRFLHDYKILTCGVFIKAPGGGTFGLHHHWTVLDDFRKYVVNFWCPLQETTIESGTLHVLPKTHKIFPEKVTFSYRSCYSKYEAELRRKYSQPLPSRPGQAVIFDNSLHHWSSPNKSSVARIAIHCTCIPGEEEPIFLYYDQRHPERFEMYRTDRDFYVRDLHVPAGREMPRPTTLPFLGYTPNENRTYTQAEYEAVIANSDEVRRQLYSNP